PDTVLTLAQIHSLGSGRRACLCESRKASASIPGQANRYPKVLPIPVLVIRLCSHHVCHLQPKKMAKARIHMKHHGSRRDRTAIVASGKTSNGIQPGHAGPPGAK